MASKRISPKRISIGEGFAKAILFGEHSVVYGYPAIVCGLGVGAIASVQDAETSAFFFTGVNANFQTQLESPSSLAEGFRSLFEVLGITSSVEIHVDLSIPTGAGLGSSAAIGAACCRALIKHFNLSEDLIESGVEAFEVVFHASPSGVDQAAALYGGFFQFSKSSGYQKIEVPVLDLVVANVGSREPTKHILERFASQKKSDETRFKVTMEEMGSLPSQAQIALTNKDLVEVGKLMTHNHSLLNEVGVSSPELDIACQIAIKAGALGAKLTGAGRGGCIISLVQDPSSNAVEKALLKAGYWTRSYHILENSGQ